MWSTVLRSDSFLMWLLQPMQGAPATLQSYQQRVFGLCLQHFLCGAETIISLVVPRCFCSHYIIPLPPKEDSGTHGSWGVRAMWPCSLATCSPECRPGTRNCTKKKDKPREHLSLGTPGLRGDAERIVLILEGQQHSHGGRSPRSFSVLTLLYLPLVWVLLTILSLVFFFFNSIDTCQVVCSSALGGSTISWLEVCRSL